MSTSLQPLPTAGLTGSEHLGELVEATFRSTSSLPTSPGCCVDLATGVFGALGMGAIARYLRSVVPDRNPAIMLHSFAARLGRDWKAGG